VKERDAGMMFSDGQLLNIENMSGAREGARGDLPPCPCFRPSPTTPRKKMDGDKVPSGDHTHAKM